MSEEATQVAQPETVAPAKPAVQSDSAQPEDVKGTEGTQNEDTQQTQGTEQQQETPEKKESRRKRQLNRERDRRIAAETELRLLKESRATQGNPDTEVRRGVESVVDPEAPLREQFATYEEFIESRAEYFGAKAAKRALENAGREQENRKAKSAQLEQSQAWEKQLESARAEIETFDEDIADSGATYTPAMGAALMESDVGAKILHYLAEHPEEADRIAKLKPSRQAAEIVSLEAKVAKTAKAVSKVSAPINPVGRSAEANLALDTRDPKAAEKLSTSEWIKRDRERMQKAGIRQ